MNMVHLITGYAGREHIQSKDTRSYNAAMFGGGEFVMEIGNQCAASIIDNHTVRVLDGDLLMQGGHIRIESNTYEDMTIDTGTAGKNRIDLIVMTYEKNADSGVEIAFLEVIKGSETPGTPTAPEVTRGTLADGALKNQMILYKVKLQGVVLDSIEKVFHTIPTYKTLAEQAKAEYKAWQAKEEARFDAWLESFKAKFDATTEGQLVESIEGLTSGSIAAGDSTKLGGIDASEYGMKSTKYNFTLSSGSWTGSEAPFSLTLTNEDFTDSNNIELIMPETVTAEQVEAYQAAMIMNGTQANGRITIKAWGEKPEINLPLIVIVRGD